MTPSQVKDIVAWDEQATKIRTLLGDQISHLVFIGNSSGTYVPTPAQRPKVLDLLVSFLNDYEQAMEKM